MNPIKEDNDLKEKVNQVYNILEKSKDKEIDTELVEVVLKTQDLLKEINNDDD